MIQPSKPLLCCVVSILVTVGYVSSATADLSLRVVRTAPLAEGVIASDVRWAGPSEVYVSLGPKGVIRTPLDTTARPVTVMPPATEGGFTVAARLAATPKHLIVGSAFGGFAWMPVGTPSASFKEKGLLTVADVDARSDTMAVLGADSGDVTGLARDGTIAWVGSLSKNLSDMRPLMRGRSQPGGKDMARCGFLETGAIRYMSDGSLVVLPGTEPGMYRYSASGKLMQTWDTAPLGIVDDCSVAQDQLELLARDFGRRLDWLAARVVVDDILPLPEGPALVLRRVEGGATKWDLVTMPFRGKPQRITLPVNMPHPRGHARGDVRGDQLVLLTFEQPLPRQKALAPPRLHLLSIGK